MSAEFSELQPIIKHAQETCLKLGKVANMLDEKGHGEEALEIIVSLDNILQAADQAQHITDRHGRISTEPFFK